MANILTMLKLEELSLVDNPANPLAFAPLYKRHDPEGVIMSKETKEEVTKAEELPQEIQDRLDRETRLDKENQLLKATLLKDGYVIKADSVEKKAVEDTIEVDGEEINKSDIPAPVLKKLEEAEVQKREMELTKRCEELLPNVKKEHAARLIEKLDMEITGEDEEVMQFLRAIDGLFAGHMEEVGKKEADVDMSDPQEKLEALIKNYMVEHKMSSKDKAQAYKKVAFTPEGKSLINEIYKGDS